MFHKIKKYGIVGVLLALWMTNSYAARMGQLLKEKWNSLPDDGWVKVIVVMNQVPDYNRLLKMDKSDVADYLRTFCARSQENLVQFLSTKSSGVRNVTRYWVFNGMILDARKDVVEDLLKRDDVMEVDIAADGYLIDKCPSDFRVEAEPQNGKYVFWNIRKIKADSVWMQGYTGAGVIIGSIDTGVDTSHPALQGKWAGYWFDGISHNAAPYDDDGHGTHTMGTMVGGDGDGSFGYDIGVAYDARYVAAKACGPSGCPATALFNSFQWYVSLVSDSGVNVVAVNNSWGSPNSTSTGYWESVMSLRSVGIVPVFAVGNDGPGSGTAGTPGNYPTVIGVGATDRNDNIASFSSRGPAPHQYPWSDTTYWPIPTWNYIKPDISAPGVSITSSVPGGGYASYDGTSMATPHITGVVALMYSKNPNLTFDQVYSILTSTADQPAGGGSYPNNNYGWGRVNALAAVNAVPSPTEPVLVMLDYEVSPISGGSHIQPGDTVNVVVTVTNLSTVTANGVTATLLTTDPYATVINGTASFGDINRGDTLDNASSPLTFAVSSSAPDGYEIPLTVRFQTSDGYTAEFDISATVGVPRMDIADLHAANAVFSLASNGALGYLDDNQSAGSGFAYRGTQTLFYGSLAAGNAPGYVVDNWYEHGTSDGDWVPTTTPPGRLYYLEPNTEPLYGDEQVWGMISDSGHATPKGLVAEFVGAAWEDDGYGDFAITLYKFQNLGTQPLNDMYFAWFMDLDISDATRNYARIDTLRRVSYMWGGATYAGISVPDTSLPIANISVISNQTYVYPDTGMVDTNEWHFMNGTYHYSQSNSANDWSVVVSVGPITLNPGDSVLVPFAIVGGTGMSAFLAHVDSARAIYYNPLVDISENPVIGSPNRGIMPFANPLRPASEIQFSLPRASFAEVRLYNAAGRLVAVPFKGMAEAGINSIKLPSGLSSGVYFVHLKSSEITDIKRIVVVR